MVAKFTTNIEKDLIQRLKIQAVKEEVKPCKIIAKVLKEYLEGVEGK